MSGFYEISPGTILLVPSGAARVPWPVTTIVSCLPALGLAMGHPPGLAWPGLAWPILAHKDHLHRQRPAHRAIRGIGCDSLLHAIAFALCRRADNLRFDWCAALVPSRLSRVIAKLS